MQHLHSSTRQGDVENGAAAETRIDYNSDKRVVAIADIRTLQDCGFELLVDERLAADESFRIFAELGNNSIHDVKEFAAD